MCSMHPASEADERMTQSVAQHSSTQECYQLRRVPTVRSVQTRADASSTNSFGMVGTLDLNVWHRPRVQRQRPMYSKDSPWRFEQYKGSVTHAIHLTPLCDTRARAHTHTHTHTHHHHQSHAIVSACFKIILWCIYRVANSICTALTHLRSMLGSSDSPSDSRHGHLPESKRRRNISLSVQEYSRKTTIANTSNRECNLLR
jgi:hypothetical protein